MNPKPLAWPVVLTLSEVTPERVSWLWPGRVPAGKLTLLVGDPEAGKSTIAVDLASRLTTGTAFPDGVVCQRGDVLYCTLEDGLADTIRPRLDAAGADVSRVHTITTMVDGDRERLLTIPADLGHVEAVVRARAVKLVILDPLKGYMDGAGNEWRDGDVRRVLGPLAQLAERTGVAVLGIVHLTKASGTPAPYRVSGSIAFTAQARSVLLAAPDPEDPDGGRRVLAPFKSSLCRRPATLTVTLSAPDGASDGAARVVWGGESAVTARQALATHSADGERSALDEAVAFLADTLADGPVLVKDIMKAARAEGIRERTLERARERLKVRSSPSGFGGSRLLSLPEQGLAETEGTFGPLAETVGANDDKDLRPVEAPEDLSVRQYPRYGGDCETGRGSPALVAQARDLLRGRPDLTREEMLDALASPERRAEAEEALAQAERERKTATFDGPEGS